MKSIRILGLDPGLRKTGWGLIEIEGSKLSYRGSGLLTSTAEFSLAERLKQLHESLTLLLLSERPEEVAVEETFVNKDAQATLKLGHARAISLLAPALLGLPVAEYAANLVKKTVTGVGHADKTQVQMMVKMLLPKADPASADAADALAVAITHAHHRKIRNIS